MRAEAAGDPGPWRQQAMLGRRDWDADALRDIVRDYVIEHLADDPASTLQITNRRSPCQHETAISCPAQLKPVW
jgi:SRSO17 transposase